MTLVRLGPSAAVKEKRFGALRAEKGGDDAFLAGCVEDARLLGSLELAGARASWQEVRASRRGEAAPVEIARLRGAFTTVAPGAALDRSALRAWHAATMGSASAWRRGASTRGVPGAPPERIEGRLEILETWLASDSVAKLKPVEAGALVLSRLVEILPFDDGNGRVSRLATGHAMRRAGGREPILVGADSPRLAACLEAAFSLDLQPLVVLLEEAAERNLDVMIQALEGKA